MIKSNYKQTEVGLIPSDWEVKKLGEIADIDIDNLSSSTNPDYCIHYISIEDVDRGVLKNRTDVSFKNAPSRARRKVKLGSILFSTVRPNLRSHLLIKDDLKDYVCSTGFSVIECIPGVADCGFVYNHFFATIVNKQIDNLISGSNYPAINSKDVRFLLIPFPPTKAEQTAIASTLRDADALINSLEKLIAKKRSIKQATMHELLKPKDGWSSEPIKNIASICTGAKNTQDKVEDGAFPFFVRSPNIERINSYSFDGEAVLVAGDGVGTGKVMHYFNGKFDFHQRVYKISNFQCKILGFYFFLYFQNNFYDRIMQLTAKSSVDSVRREMISEMQIPFPSIEEQTHIASVLSDMDSEINALEKKLNKYKSIKQGMMQNLLTGKIRLINNQE